MQVTSVTREAWKAGYQPDMPPARWFVRGPRGGIHMAGDDRERLVSEDFDFLSGKVTVCDRSRSSRYVRPGTALHREATEALA